jgi:hypothetical protein
MNEIYMKSKNDNLEELEDYIDSLKETIKLYEESYSKNDQDHIGR